MRIVADGTQRLDEWRCSVGAPMDRHALGREVDPRPLDARYGADRVLDPFHAGAAMNAGNRKIGLMQSVAEVAAGEKQLSLGAAAAIGFGHYGKRGARCAATHRVPSASQVGTRVASTIVVLPVRS